MTATAELIALYERDGYLTPEQVLEAARPAQSPLHSHFEWDDSAAAAKYRLAQAGHLIRSCKWTIETRDDETVKVRRFAHVADAGYMPLESALGDQSSRDVVLAQARRELAAFRRKYAALVDVDALFASEIRESAAA